MKTPAARLARATALLALLSFLPGVSAAAAAPASSSPAGAVIAPAPALPKGVYAYWNSGKTVAKKDELTVVDLVGQNHLSVAGPWFSLGSGGGFFLDGSQAEGIRLTRKQPVGNRFALGVDINPDPDGPEHQTIAYLYRFCELRYRLSRRELSLNVWQTTPDDGTKELVSSAVLPVPAGKWSRVQVQIEDTLARLVVGEAKAEAKLAGTWEFLPDSVVFLIGKGGSTRAYRGHLDHLYLAQTP